MTERDIGGGEVGTEAAIGNSGEVHALDAEADEDSGEEDQEDQEASDGDDASVVDEKAVVDEEPSDPLEILVFPLPVQPEVVKKHVPQQVDVDEEEYDEDGDVQAVSPFCLPHRALTVS